MLSMGADPDPMAGFKEDRRQFALLTGHGSFTRFLRQIVEPRNRLSNQGKALCRDPAKRERENLT